MPLTQKAHESEDWLNRDKSKIKDLTAIAKTTDWSFSTPYKGSVLQLSSSLENVLKETKFDAKVLEHLSKATDRPFKASLVT